MPAIHDHIPEGRYDVIVVGAGHAGAEAAHAASRMGSRVLLVTFDPNRAALMSCNPAIGGLAKGQLAREIDALGGMMGRAADATGIQFRLLNTSKGPAVRAPRAQIDKAEYSKWVSDFLRGVEGIDIVQGQGVEVLTGDAGVEGLALSDGRSFAARAVVLTAGTFLDGLIHIGLRSFPAGRAGDPAAVGLADSLRRLGLETGRLKTGTPARLDRDSIDWSVLPEQPGDETQQPFSFETARIEREQVPCHVAETNPSTHEAIRAGLDRSPLFTGVIEGAGPRYCPSIEDKVVRFPERERHQIFLEPEGRTAREIYPNGISTSLPEDVQRAFLRTIRGLERVRILRLGYAIEYTFCPPRQLRPTLESKAVPGLYLAGQLNATSGYEEAAAQGLMAGANAALKIHGEPPLVLGRHEAYIGVLIDDLIAKDHSEPYRMFTSRAEFRLALRHDNADLRLTEHGRRLGMIDDRRYERFRRKRDALDDEIRRLERARPDRERLLEAFRSRAATPPEGRPRASELLARPDLDWAVLSELGLEDAGLSPEVAEQVHIHFRYAGYLRKEAAQVERFKRLAEKAIPEGFDYSPVAGLRKEAADKLGRFRPSTLGQASRIAGVTPADISVLMVALKASLGWKPS
jgi:tRNA uridine 5-carboxymethylaminomethyl modification enzyme